jgi:hypothetical protein
MFQPGSSIEHCEGYQDCRQQRTRGESMEEKSCLMEESLMITRLWVFFGGEYLRE